MRGPGVSGRAADEWEHWQEWSELQEWHERTRVDKWKVDESQLQRFHLV